MAIGTALLLFPAVLRFAGLGRPEAMDALPLAIGLLVWFVVAYVVASVVFVLSKRSQTWANAVFLSIAVFAMLGGLTVAFGGRPGSERVPSARAESGRAAPAWLTPAQSEAAVATVVPEVVGRVQKAASDYAGIAEKFSSAGGLDLATLGDRESVVARLAIIIAAVRANQAFDTALRDSVSRLQARLREEGVSEDRVIIATDEYRERYSVDALLRIRVVDERLFQDAAELLEILRDESGRWSIGTRGQVVWDAAVSPAKIRTFESRRSSAIAALDERDLVRRSMAISTTGAQDGLPATSDDRWRTARRTQPRF